MTYISGSQTRALPFRFCDLHKSIFGRNVGAGSVADVSVRTIAKFELDFPVFKIRNAVYTVFLALEFETTLRYSYFLG